MLVDAACDALFDVLSVVSSACGGAGIDVAVAAACGALLGVI